MKHADHHTTAKSVIAVLIVLLAFVVYMIFQKNQNNLLQSEMLTPFVVLVMIFFALLIGLFYLVSQPLHPHSKSAKKKQ